MYSAACLPRQVQAQPGAVYDEATASRFNASEGAVYDVGVAGDDAGYLDVGSAASPFAEKSFGLGDGNSVRIRSVRRNNPLLGGASTSL